MLLQTFGSDLGHSMYQNPMDNYIKTTDAGEISEGEFENKSKNKRSKTLLIKNTKVGK